MCARYELNATPEEVMAHFSLMDSVLHILNESTAPEIRPTDPAPVIGFDNTVDALRWGLDVSWQKQPVINARAETAERKPTFSPLLNRRVIVPASAYLEWRRSGTEKIKTRIGLEGEPVIAMAGLRTDERFTILTCSPSPEIANIHNRMPVLLDAQGATAWLNPDLQFADLAHLLAPYPGPFDTMEISSGKPRQTDLFD